LEDEAKGGFVFAVDFGVGVDATKELEESPEDEAEEEGVAFRAVSWSVEWQRDGNTYAVLPARIISPIVMSGYIEFWNGI
jgi:hypothetical protein